MLNEFQTRIGTIIQAEKISSLTGARDVGGAIVTASGRIVIAAGISDGELNYPYSIVVSDDGGDVPLDQGKNSFQQCVFHVWRP